LATTEAYLHAKFDVDPQYTNVTDKTDRTGQDRQADNGLIA